MKQQQQKYVLILVINSNSNTNIYYSFIILFFTIIIKCNFINNRCARIQNIVIYSVDTTESAKNRKLEVETSMARKHTSPLNQVKV